MEMVISIINAIYLQESADGDGYVYYKCYIFAGIS